MPIQMIFYQIEFCKMESSEKKINIDQQSCEAAASFFVNMLGSETTCIIRW